MDESLTSYLTNLLPIQSEWVQELEAQAQKDRVPIMDPVSMQFIMQLIRLQQPKRILELGTAIGYSALRMLEAYPKATIVTLERDEQRYQQAVRNINAQQKQEQIDIMLGDALDIVPDVLAKGPFNMVLIDAAKGQYQKFFTLYSPAVANSGVIITDNVLFKGYVSDQKKQHPRFQKLGGKIRSYNEWLIDHPDYHTSIIPIGDGVAMSIKKFRREHASSCKKDQL
ncbi:O-methyltransferase [Lentibacillus sp. N15]|uniref:O-methyltransferase n=1 Tax=Lentibacillus songyuanensis TaxID=3136161 RepID=UPI0031BADA28